MGRRCLNVRCLSAPRCGSVRTPWRGADLPMPNGSHCLRIMLNVNLTCSTEPSSSRTSIDVQWLSAPFMVRAASS